MKPGLAMAAPIVNTDANILFIEKPAGTLCIRATDTLWGHRPDSSGVRNRPIQC